MGGQHSHQRNSDSSSLTRNKNSLGLSPFEVNDINYVVSLVASDTTSHCIQAHIKYFRQNPQHLESFCGRPEVREPRHYSPQKLCNDKQFSDRAVIHGLALLQVLRCSIGGDQLAMDHLATGLAHAHSGMKFTNDILKDYADVLIDYLKSQFEVAMTPAVTLSWKHFLYGLASAMSNAKNAPFSQNLPLRLKPEDEKDKLIQGIRNTMMYDPQAVTRTAASLIRSCQRKILETSPPLSHIPQRKKAEENTAKDDTRAERESHSERSTKS